MFKLNSFRHEQTKNNISMTKQLCSCTLKSLAFIRMRVYVFYAEHPNYMLWLGYAAVGYNSKISKICLLTNLE